MTQVKNKVEFKEVKALVDSLEFSFERVGTSTVIGCWGSLLNGFFVGYGEAACLDPAEFKLEQGKEIAKARCIQNATNELFKMEGYLLKVTGKTSEDFVS